MDYNRNTKVYRSQNEALKIIENNASEKLLR